MLYSVGCFLAFSLTCLAVVAMAQAPNDSASGSLQVAKNRITLKYAFAVMEEDPFSNVEKEKLTVLLSDIPVPEALRKGTNEWRLWVSDQAAKGAIHGLVVNTIRNPRSGTAETS